MRPHIKATLFAAILLHAALTSAAPIVLLQYTFPTAHGAGVETGSGFNPTTVAAGIDALYNMAVRDTAGTITIGTENPSPNYASQPVLRVDPDGSSSSLAQAITNNKYFVFSFQPEDGYYLDLLRLDFNAARGGSSTPRGWGLRSSADAYTTTLGNSDIGTQRATWTSYSVPLTAAYFDQVTDTLTFRIYVYSPANGSTIEFDDITIWGEVFELEVIPEPGTLSLPALGVLGLLRRRRRK